MEDIFVLTEVKNSRGCLFLKKYFQTYGYHVVFPNFEDNRGYGSMIASKTLLSTKIFKHTNFISPRVVCGQISLPHNIDIEIIGIYAPSRDASEEKIKRKKSFLQVFSSTFQKMDRNKPRIICGDFNLRQVRQPHYQKLVESSS